MSSTEELRRLANELLSIADRESKLRTDAAPLPQRDESNASEALSDPDYLLQLADAIYRSRQIRVRHFPSDLFGEPAWDILLDLFAAKCRGVRISITSACIASQVPHTTALRWLGLLEEDGWIIREDDETDGRRAFIRLSGKGETATARYLVEAGNIIRPRLKHTSVFKDWAQ